jgi:two-component system sensor histidine kinase/response regulator
MKKSIIFCVDDEKIVLNAIKSELKNSFGDKYIIETAENGQEALDTIDDLISEGFNIPLIISDYAMPVIKGDELLSMTHEKTPLTVNILLTGQATVEGVANAINKASLYRYIAKPWETNDLILTVEQALKSYDQQNQLEKQNKELRELSFFLDLKVKERTVELLGVNELLQGKQKEIIIQNEELERHRNQLEELVRIRTAELERALEKAKESDLLKSAFLTNVSHEIRTPMNGIIGFIDLIKSTDYGKQKQDEYLNVIVSCSTQLLGIINDIVEMSRLDTNQVKMVIVPCRLQETINNLCDLFKRNIELNTNLVFRTIGNTSDLYILTDEVKLCQILTNLINNAIKNTFSGSIELRFSIVQNKEILFSVKDTGIGIPEEFHEKIFERFRQVDTGFSRMQEGTGLGLSISKAYVELLGGRIWIESERNCGSTFFFTIPYKPVMNKRSADESLIYDLIPNHNSISILIVEDVDINFQFTEVILTDANFHIIRAKNGQEAVDICKSNENIDLVLMDIKMPVMNGYTAATKIQEFRKDLPIIAQTAFAFPGDKLKAIQCGCVDYISKPFDRRSLLKIVNTHLKKKYANQS